MKNELLIAALLHDIGWIYFRSGQKGEHAALGARLLEEINANHNFPIFLQDIISAVANHHPSLIDDKLVANNSLAHILGVANNITAKTFSESSHDTSTNNLPLKSVYSLLNFKSEDKFYSGLSDFSIEDFILPGEEREISNDIYKSLISRFNKYFTNSSRQGYDTVYINSLIEFLRSLFYYIPASTNEPCDISFFSHSKMTACVAHCIYDYLITNNRTDFKTEIYEKEFLDENVFLMASADISGIQKFIYTISTDSAQKQLRARSIYLELVMENFIDELLCEMGYTRANLLYSGGGHCYLLFANTERNLRLFSDIIKRQNDWFIEHFGISLYVAGAAAPCSANNLFPNNVEGAKNYKAVFGNLSKAISIKKVQRYDIEQIRKLNGTKEAKRECRICGIAANTDNNICQVCNSLIAYGSQFLKKDVRFVLSKPENGKTKGLQMFSYRYRTSCLKIAGGNQADEIKDDIIRIYSKNTFDTTYHKDTTILMGDYAVERFTFDDYAEKSKGIKRLGIHRADVDNLGKAFVSGFDVDLNKNYTNLSRISAFSESLSLFFKYYINAILRNDNCSCRTISLTGEDVGRDRNISVVYSGGDDLFIIGAWNEVLEFAIDLYNLFTKYSLNKLTISAGFGLYPKKYPISSMALETGRLEELAKSSGKNRIALFDERLGFVFQWHELQNEVIREKLYFLQQHYFNKKDNEDASRGSAEIYRIKSLIEKIEEDKNNLARLAYALARINENLKKSGKENRVFINRIYEWSKGEKDRKQLLAALTLLLYLNRGEKDDE
jgi:CRISPR-associated protein Csm1